MVFVNRLIRSMRTTRAAPTLRSAMHHAQKGLSKIGDAGYDRAHGTRTGGVVEVDQMTDVHSPSLRYGMRYEPSRAHPFHRFVRSLDLPRDGVFVDVGCGKGRVLIMAAEIGFRRVVGIEYSPALCAEARHNVAARPPESLRGAEIRIVETDAADYAFEPDQNVIYMFNPFDDAVMRPVLDRIDASLAEAPRSLWLIYQCPTLRDTIESRSIFTPTTHAWHGGCEFVVYRTTGARPSP